MLHSTSLDHAARPSAGRRAIGFRRTSAETVAWRRRADGYAGLPAGIRHPHEAIDALRQARAGLGLSDAEMTLLADLYAATQPKDWQRRPIAWPSNDTIAARMGRSVSAIQRMIARLAERGLVVMRDSPTGKRYGLRGPDGHIVKAYGFDLSLVALRIEEWRAIAAAKAAEAAQIKAARAEGGSIRRKLLAILDTAEESGAWTEFWIGASREAARLSDTLYKTRTLSRLSGVTQELARLLAAVERALAETRPAPAVVDRPEHSTSSDDVTPSAHGVDATLNNTTNSPHNDDCNRGQQACKSGAAPAYPEFARDRGRYSDAGNPLDHVDVARLATGAPELARQVDVPASWSELRARCLPLLARYDIARRLFDDAEDRLGQRMPTMIFCLMLAHGRDHYQSPGGAFRRMAERAEQGRLHILPSYYGLTGRSDARPPSGPAPHDATHLARAL